MKKNLIKIVLLLIFFICPKMAFAGEVAQYFNSFYYSYLSLLEVPNSERNLLNLIKQISDNKVYALEGNLKTSKTKEEIEAALILINEEYYDLIENINFELGYVNHIELGQANNKKLEKAHKRFMRQLKRNNLKLLR